MIWPSFELVGDLLSWLIGGRVSVTTLTYACMGFSRKMGLSKNPVSQRSFHDG